MHDMKRLALLILCAAACWKSAGNQDKVSSPPPTGGPDVIAVEKLPPEFRLVFLLSTFGEFPYREISEIVGIPIGTVMSRLHRGRKQLQRRLWNFGRERGLIPEGAVEPAPEIAGRTRT